jgi:hypothetical protein
MQTDAAWLYNAFFQTRLISRTSNWRICDTSWHIWSLAVFFSTRPHVTFLNADASGIFRIIKSPSSLRSIASGRSRTELLDIAAEIRPAYWTRRNGSSQSKRFKPDDTQSPCLCFFESGSCNPAQWRTLTLWRTGEGPGRRLVILPSDREASFVTTACLTVLKRHNRFKSHSLKRQSSQIMTASFSLIAKLPFPGMECPSAQSAGACRRSGLWFASRQVIKPSTPEPQTKAPL